MDTTHVSTAVLDRLDEIFTRSFYSAAGYAFESQPYVVPEDAELLDLLTQIRAGDKRHAVTLADHISMN